MTTSADFTTRARTEMFSIYQAQLTLARRVQDLTDEVSALGGPAMIFVNGFPEQGDGFTVEDLANAYEALGALIATPTQAQKNALIKARRS